MQILENVSLAPYTTLQVGGPARYFVEAERESAVVEALEHAQTRSLPVFVLGGGSNLVISDRGWPGLVIKVAVKGISIEDHDGKRLFVAGAGEKWDALVAKSVEQNCSGIECMSGIPGTVGGTPVQNVGAYGQEVAETITSVRVVDRKSGQVQQFSNSDCGFAYRTSIFNSAEKDRYIVTEVSYLLNLGGKPRMEYADLKKHFAAAQSAPTLREVRQAVLSIRAGKGMLISADDEDSRSAGSFFKNPIVSAEEYERLASLPACKEQKPPRFAAPNGQVKISAAWLVEHAGFHKGYAEGRVGISHKHSLAIVNRGYASATEVAAFKDKVQEGVWSVFGLNLQPEPVLVGF